MYYLWLNEAQAGPYSLKQVQSMWNDGKITALTLYWQKGQEEWQPLGNIIALIEGGDVANQTTAIPELQKPVGTDKTAAIPDLQKKKYVRPSDYIAKPEPELVEESASAHPEQIQWAGHPTLWKWTGLIFLALILCLLPVGIYMYQPSPLIAAAPLPIALILFIYIIVSRSSTKYSVSNKRVGVETGIFTKTSRELRIEDIRSINATINFIGYGNIEFSSAASDDAEVIFHAVPCATYVRDLVKKLQS